jgi:hypothetical protein
MTEFKYIHDKLSKDYAPTDEDILCGRGKARGKHPGNKKFSAAIRANLQTYGEAPKRVDKSNVVVSIIRSLRVTAVNLSNKTKEQSNTMNSTRDKRMKKPGTLFEIFKSTTTDPPPALADLTRACSLMRIFRKEFSMHSMMKTTGELVTLFF